MDDNSDSATLRRLQLTQLEILDEFVRVCEKHNLAYFLVGGTLLGAVRHKGFIPWDDDIDVGMPRKDYEKFLTLCETELDKNFYLLSSRTYPPCWFLYATIHKKNTLLYDAVNNGCNHPGPEHRGICIDIFPYDSTVKNHSLQKIKRFIINNLKALIVIKRGVELPESKAYGLKKIIAALLSFKLLHQLVNFTAMHGFTNQNYVIAWYGMYGDEKETFSTDVFFPLSTIIFEGKNYSAPNKPEKYLSQLYGDDYMQLPPEEKRKTLNFKSYMLVFDTTKDADKNSCYEYGEDARVKN